MVHLCNKQLIMVYWLETLLILTRDHFFYLDHSLLALKSKKISCFKLKRFGTVWTGDNRATEEHMQISVPMLLQMSVSGLGFVGADIGGFFPNDDIYETTEEASKLMSLWHSLGVFYPFMRQHSHQQHKRREPYIYKDEVFDILKWSLKQRQLLLPYV